MKKVVCLIALVAASMAVAQTSTVTYSASTDIIANPERGFYRHEGTHSDAYDPLNQSSLAGFRTNSKITLILRLFYLENFINAPISSSYLQNMQSDFAKVRAAGLKCVVRFAYSDDYDSGQPQDATKAQMLAHIAQLKPILTANADVIAVLQAGFIGTWGEWYYTSNFGMNPSASDFNNRREIVDALLNAIPTNRYIQIRTPKLKRSVFSVTTALTQAQAFQATNVSRTGHHNDCFLASSTDEGTYGNIATDYPYLEQETRYTPMGGETCAVNAPRSECTTAIQEFEKFHWSYINLDYHPGVISDWQADACFSEIEKRLGYRFELRTGIFPQTATIGTQVPVTLKIQNIGFAAPFNQRTAYIVFRNTVSNAEHRVALTSDPRLWSSGVLTTITENLTLPATITSGSYKMYLALPDSDSALATRPEYAIRMANNNTWEATTGYNNLNHTITINSALSVGDHDADAPSLVVYPIPANDQLVLQFPGISDYKVLVYNSLGQTIGVDTSSDSSDKIIVNTSTLSNGVYFVSIHNGSKKETKRIIVSH